MENHASWPRIVLFDGECILCNSTVDFLLKTDKKRLLKFATLQSDAAKNILQDESIENRTPETILYYDNGIIYKRSKAVLKILMLLGFPFSLAAVFYIIPTTPRDWIYDFIAKNRYKWFGTRECRIPDEKTKERMLG